MSTPTKQSGLHRKLAASLLVAGIVVGPGAAAEVVGPVPNILTLGQFYAGFVEEGESDYLECRVLDCPTQPVCGLSVTPVRLELTTTFPEDVLVLRAFPGRGYVETQTEGVPPSAQLDVVFPSTCLDVWVVGAQVGHVAPYVLRVIYL
jgi:hypothetical protein